MQFLLFKHLSAEQMAENAQADSRSLYSFRLYAPVVVNLSADDAANNCSHDVCHHQHDIGVRSRPDSHIDELFAKPHHQQTEHHTPDSRHDAQQHIHPDAHRVMPQPYYVSHLFTVYSLQFTVYGLRFTVYGLRFTVYSFSPLTANL